MRFIQQKQENYEIYTVETRKQCDWYSRNIKTI